MQAGNYLFFRGNNSSKAQVLLGVGKIGGTVTSNTSNIPTRLWNDPQYTNLIFIKHFYKFNDPIIISSNNNISLDPRLINMNQGAFPYQNDFHRAYNMFRAWRFSNSNSNQFMTDIFNIPYEQMY